MGSPDGLQQAFFFAVLWCVSEHCGRTKLPLEALGIPCFKWEVRGWVVVREPRIATSEAGCQKLVGCGLQPAIRYTSHELRRRRTKLT